ncbi:hypothetical protein MAR_006934 [Mya arenaria]|uniref:BTB domain-containing protein n=1 Tax=Mya arenaria TaxID=6604 RepID=A0ABY7DC20_MYAAR|nr:hypothetical protein MAR_006934 [Mya arenaria]
MMSQKASCPSKHRPSCSDVGQQVRARVSSTKTLCESLKLILDMPEMCDVKFLVGADNTPVHVRLTIPVHKYDAEVFRMLMQFIHCGTATITDQTVTGLLCGACQFELGDLEVACCRYLRARLSSGHEESILDGSRKYKQHRKYAFIMEQIYKLLNQRFHLRKSSRTTKARETDV